MVLADRDGRLAISRHMHIDDAQREMRARFGGRFYGQLVSKTLWIAAEVLSLDTPRTSTP